MTTKMSGVGAALLVNQYDISGDVGALTSMGYSRGLQDVTGLDKDGTERIGLRIDSEMSYAAFWNTSAGRSVAVLEPLTEALVTFCRRASLGSPTRTLTGVKSSWSVARGQDGSMAANGQIQASNGRPIEGGYLLTSGKQTFASAAAGTYIDRGAGSASSFGAAAVLHVISLGSGTATVKVQESSDHSTWADALTFANVSGATSEYKRTSSLTATIRRYVRIDVSGTFTNLVAVVAVVPYRSQQS